MTEIGLKRGLDQNKMCEAYDDVFREESGIEFVDDKKQGTEYYLPRRPVIRGEKITIQG